MRKKFLPMTFLLAIIGFCGTNLRAEGDLQITSEKELRDFAVSVNGGNSYYGEVVTLANDITLTGEWTPIGTGSRSSKSYSGNAFKGTFDGGNHTISGLTITSTSGADAAVGLFGIVDGGTVKNLNLTDVNINVTNSNLAGAAIGMMLNGATADYITVSGTIIGYDGVGGIVGRLIIDGTISNCINNASVTSSYGGIGGIVGKAYYEDGANTSTFASVTKCTNKGTVTAPMYIGGIAGLARANVTDCINEGAIVGGTQTGGIVGQLIAAGTVSGNENKAKVSGKNHLGGIIGDYSQSSAYTYYNVSIANNINRGELAATEQCAAIMGCNNIDGFTAMTATGNVSYYYVEGLELFGNPEDMIIDETNKFIIPVAKIDDVEYSTLAEAVEAAKSGDEIIMLSDATLDSELTLPAGITFNGNGKQINGNIVAAGDLSFVGHTKVTSFNAGYNKPVITISEGACLEIIGTGRMVIGHGATFNINGNIVDAKTADKATLTPSIIMPGASFTGAGVTFNVTNAYISAPSSYCSSSSSASGTFDFNITNSIWESAGKLAFESQSTAATVNFDLVESVLNTGSHLVFGVSRGEVVIDNSNVNVGTSRQIENQSTMTIKNGSVVNGAVATSSNAKNPGTLIVEDATYAVIGEFSGSDLGTGTLIMKNGASFTAGSITKANIQIDATGMAIGDEINLTANLANHAGTLEVINNDNLDAEIKDGKIVLVEKPVAKIGETEYATLQAALNAAAQTEELTTIQLLAGTHTFGNVKFPATLKNVTIVGADNKATIIKDSKLYSADGNAVTYNGITFDGIVFDNSSILFTGARNGEVVYEDWTIKKCDFRNLQSTDGIAAIHFNLAADETIKNFTFEKNTITNVTSPSNSASGLRLNYVTGDVVIKDNETNNVAFNAVQIINSEVANFTFEGNILRSNSSSLANLYNVTGENIVITKNQFLANENQKSVSNIEYADVSGNYWGGGAPTHLPEGVVYSSYYTTVESDGTLGGLVELPQGNQPIGYVSETTIWGETWSNARTSYVIKVKDAGGNVMGTSTLNPELYTFNGNVAPTWHISFDPSTDNDTYWIQEWTTVPSINNMPAKVALWVDGVEVNEGPVKFNSPDDIDKIYAATADAEGKLIRFYNSIETIVNNEANVNVVLVRDVTGSFETFHNVTLYSGVEGGASITNTYSADYTNFNKVIVKNGVTLNMNNVFSTTAESVNTIEGTMNVVGVYYHSSDAKTEIKNGGKVTTGGMTIVRYNNNPESGIYIYGDGDDATIEFSCQGDAIGAYSGTFYAEDAEVETKGLRLDYKKDDSEESDEYAQINAKFVDTKLSVSYELRLYKDAALTLNGATVTAGKVQIRQNATPTINIDNSTIKANSVENLSGATWNAVMDEDGYVTFVRTGLAGEGTEANPYLINNLEDLVFFRDQVNGGVNYYEGKYVALGADINLAGENWVGIGTATTDHGFMGNFDGKTYKIMNLTITDPALDSDGYAYAGFFGVTEGTDKDNQNTIKNLTIENVTISTTGHIVSAAIAYPYYTIVDNVKVCGNINITGGDYTSGVLAYTRRCVNASNITVEGGENSYITGANVVGGVISDIQMNGGLTANYSNFEVSGVTITGTNMVGGISGIISSQTLNGATVRNVTLNSSDARVGIVAGCLGGTSTISNVTYENVTGATAVVGATYDGGKAVEAKIGDTYYATLQTALDAVVEGTSNGTVELISDIDLTDVNWTPVGTETKPFIGSFNGNEHTIKKLNIVETEAVEGKAYVGLFGYAKNATIKNVTFENVNLNIACLDIDHSQGHIGAVAGSLEGTSTIENVTVKGDITVEATFDANGASRVAVVAGGNSYGNVTMKNVHVIANEGSYLKANNNVGALAGQLQGKSVFENCSSNIDVTGMKFFAGGIIGLAAGDQTFTNCHTTGDVKITAGREGRANDQYRVGGIAGGWADGKTKVCTLTDCTYTGNVSGTNADGSVANPLDYAGYVGRGYTLANCAGSKVVIDGVEYVQVYDTIYGIYEVNGNIEINTAVALKTVAETPSADSVSVVLGDDITLTETIKINAVQTRTATENVVTIDLNGNTITGTDNATGSFALIEIQPGAELIIEDSSEPSTGNITLTATNNREWNAYSSVISNQRGKLTVNGGTIEHLGGTDMAYGIDNLTNGKGTYAETVINGGYIKSTYRGIRQFLNGTEAQNILTVNGGTIEGANKSIWMQDPSVNANTGTLEVRKEANLIGDVYLYVTPNSTSWPVEVSIAAEALAEGSEVLTGNVPAGYELKLVDGVYGVCSVEAKIGEVTYATLAAAVNAANEGDTITLVTDITFTEATRTHNSGSWYDGLYYSGDKSFTIDLASYTIGHDNSVNDYLLNFKNEGAKANVINLINGTIEAGSTAYCALATSGSNTNKITINTENINIINNNSYGSTIKVRGGVELNVNAGTVITGTDSYLGIECVASTVNIYDGAEIYMNGSTSLNGCLVGACANGTVNVYGGYGEGVKGGFIAMTSGGTINVAGGEWIANTDGTVGNNSNLYVLTAQNNKDEPGYAGASIINVTGGTFRGGMDAWILNDVNVEKAELNISGGNFNADPTSYVDLNNYKVVNEDNGTYTVEVDGFEKFYTAAGEVTEQANAAYSLMFTVTDYASKEVSVKIGNKPAQNSAIHLVTPETVEFDNVEFDVTSVANSAFNGTSFKKVTISEGVKTIGNKALYFMSKLTELVLPKTLVSVGEQCIAAYNPNSVPLKSIVCYAEEAPSAFEPTSNASFQTCVEQQTMLIVPNAADYTVYSNASGWKFTNILGIGSTKEIAGKDDKYTLLATVTSMNPMECSIKIGNTKPAANSNAELVIPETVTFFEGYDFNVTSIPNNAFSSCLYFVGDLVIPQNVRTIGAGAFNTSHFVANETVRGTLTLNEGLVSIGSQAFKKDYFKGDLSIPSTVETIASNAFQYASFDGTLTINGNIYCANAFGGTGFTELVLVEGVEEIKDSNAFSGMLSLKEVVLPSTLQTVGMAAFKDDDAIEVIHTYATEVPAINSIPGNVNYKYAFSETVKANAVLYVHGTSYDDVLKYKNATNEWNEFANIHLYGAVAQIGEVEYLTLQAAMNAAENGKTITMIANAELTETVTIPAGKEVVLDLNGYTVSYTTTEYVGEAMITNNGNLTITDTSDEETGSLSYAYKGGANSSYGFGNSTIENKGVLTINAGTVQNTSEAMSHASYAINTGAGATLNLEGGNILNLNGHAVRMVSFGTELNTVNINGGYIEGTRALQVQLPGSASAAAPEMKLNITGGELKSNEETYNLAIYVFSNDQSAENVSLSISDDAILNGNVAINAAATNSMLANAVAITGGTFNGDYGIFSYSDEASSQAVISIVGGTFATNYSEWYAEDDYHVFEENEDGTYSVVEQTIFTQTRELAQGWNWFSYYVNTDLTALETALGENGVQITSKTDGFVAYNSQYGWSGNLSSITESQMYMINVGASHDLELSGELVGPTSITLHQGWNWIGFPMSEAVSVTDALACFEAKSGDQIKSKDNGFASYNSQYGWGGTLSTLNPGEGYMYQSNNSETTELFYSAGTRGELKANVTTDGNHWIPNAGQYPNNMTMTAMVEVEGGDYEVAAFVDGEVRGSARPIYVEALDSYMLFLTIHGEGVEEMTFKFYDLATGEEYALNDRINYSNDAIIGSLTEPYIFNRGTTGIGEASLSDINIYPNPTTTGTEINLQSTCDTVEVFNALGVKVAEYHNVDSIDAFETAGIYVIRITDNGDVKHCRLIVK